MSFCPAPMSHSLSSHSMTLRKYFFLHWTQIVINIIFHPSQKGIVYTPGKSTITPHWMFGDILFRCIELIGWCDTDTSLEPFSLMGTWMNSFLHKEFYGVKYGLLPVVDISTTLPQGTKGSHFPMRAYQSGHISHFSCNQK